MSQTLTVTTELPKDRYAWISCGNCGKVNCHQVLTSAATTDSFPKSGITAWEDYLAVQCGGCKTVSFCVESSCSEGYFYNHETDREEVAISTRLYPSRIEGRSELEHAHFLPHNVYLIYEETRASLSNDLLVLAGIGIRAIVETVCKERSAKGRNLKDQIDDLVPLGIMTPDAAKILHSLRFMGNVAAHEVKAHTQEELTTALEVTEYLLRGTYILPKLATKLPKEGA